MIYSPSADIDSSIRAARRGGDKVAVLQLAGHEDYIHLVNLFNSPGMRAQLVRISMEKDYILDTYSRDLSLRISNAMLSARQVTEQFPDIHRPLTFRIVYYETCLRNFTDNPGNMRSAMGMSNWYFEMSETEEDIDLNTMQQLTSGSEIILNSSSNSTVLQKLSARYPNSVASKIHRIGSLTNLRRVYQVSGFPHKVEVDKCQLPCREVYFLRLPSSDTAIEGVLKLLHLQKVKLAPEVKSLPDLFTESLCEIPEHIPLKSLSTTTPDETMQGAAHNDLNELMMKFVNSDLTNTPSQLSSNDLNTLFNPPKPTLDPIDGDLNSCISSASASTAALHQQENGVDSTKKNHKRPASPRNRKRNSEASARYRQRKNNELIELRARIKQLEEEVAMWKEKAGHIG